MFLHANDEIKKALKFDDKNYSYIKWQGKILFKLEEYQKAEEYLNNYLSFENDDAEFFSLLGYSCLKNDKISEAQNFFYKALELDSSYDLANKGLELCLNKKK